MTAVNRGPLNASVRLAQRLGRDVHRVQFSTPSHVYNPLRYAWPAHRQYLQRFGAARGRVLLLGMNPGPWGMAQTGVPFGEVGMVRDWLGIHAPLHPPLPLQHPGYPIRGLDCTRSEGSGRRFWGWARARFGSPEEVLRALHGVELLSAAVSGRQPQSGSRRVAGGRGRASAGSV